MSSESPPAPRIRIPFRPGFLAGSLVDLENVRLAGSRCGDCGTALFGERHRCENCSSRNLTPAVFSADGVVHTYTIQRYPPPKPNALPEPWVPRPLAWIDLAEAGPRILSPVDCAAGDIAIGASVHLSCAVGWLDADGREVVSYQFVLAAANRRN